MKTYNLEPKNRFMSKTFLVERTAENKNTIHVKSAFLGSWTFTLNNFNYDTLCLKLNRYCSNGEMIQDVFSELTPDQRECFLTDPKMSLFLEGTPNEI